MGRYAAPSFRSHIHNFVSYLPGASILELGDWGIRPARWEDLYLVGAWRRFLTEPDSYFRHLLADDTQTSDP